MSILEYIDSSVFSPVYQNSLPSVSSPNMERICSTLFYTIKGDEKIFIYGDYDMDGFCAAKVWSEVLSTLYNVKPVHFKYVNRQHTLDKDILNQVKEHDVNVILILDTGSSKEDAEIISLLRFKGYTPIVIDHHQWHGDYMRDTKDTLVFNAYEERELLGGHTVSGGYASLLVAKLLSEKYFKRPLSYAAMEYALASMYSDSIDMSTPPARALYNLVNTLNIDSPILLRSLNSWGYKQSRRLYSFILAPKFNACFRTENFKPLNDALDPTLNIKHSISKVVSRMDEAHNEASSLVSRLMKLFTVETFGNISLCTHEATDETRYMHIRNFSGLIANKFAQSTKGLVVIAIKDGGCYEGSVRDYFDRPMLDTFQVFCKAGGHAAAFGIAFHNLNDVKKNLRILSKNLESNQSRNIRVLNSSLITTREDVQALALYNEYMNVKPKILVQHRCPNVRTVRQTSFYWTYDVCLPYSVILKHPICEGTNLLLEPTICKSVELRSTD